MAINQDFKITIDVNTSDARKAFNVLREDASKIVGSFSKLQKSVISLNQGFELIGRAVSGMQRGFEKTVGQFASFQKALIGVGKTTNLSDDVLSQFGKDMQSLSQTIPVSTNELLNIAQIAGQLGVTGADNLSKFAETVSKISVSTNLTADQAATDFTRILTVTGEGVENIDKFASVIVRLGNNFAATESEISRMTNEVSRSTAQFRLASFQTAAIATSLKQMGVQAQLGGSVIGKAFRMIEESIETGGDQFKALMNLTGMTGDQLKKTFKEDSTAVFKAFIDGLNTIYSSGQSVSMVLEQFNLKGDEVNKVLPVLAARSDVLASTLRHAADEMQNTNALNTEASKVFSSLGSQMKITMNTITNFAVDIGSKLAPAVTNILKSIQDFFLYLRELSKAIATIDFDRLSESAKNLGTAIVVVASAISILNINSILFMLYSWTTATWALVTAKYALIKPLIIVAAKVALITLAITALIAGIEFLINNSKKLGNILVESLSRAGAEIALAWAKSKIAILQYIQDVMIGLNKIGLVSSDAIMSISDSIESAKSDIDNYAKDIDQSKKNMEELTATAWNFGLAGEAVKQVKNMFSSMNSEIEKAQDNAKNLTKAVDEVGLVVGQEGPLLPGQTRKPLEKPIKPMSDDDKKMMEDFIKKSEDINNQLARRGKTERELINLERDNQEMAIAAFEKQLRDQGKLGKEQKQAIASYREAIAEQKEAALAEKGLSGVLGGGVVEAAGNAMAGMATSMMAALNPAGIFMEAANAIVGAIQGVIDFIPNLLSSITKIFTSLTELPMKIVENMGALLDSIIGFITSFIPNLMQMIPDLLMEVVTFIAESLPDAILSLAESIPDMLSKILERLPEIAMKFGEALVKMDPTVMALRFIMGLIKSLPKLVDSFIKIFITGAPEIALSIANGIIEAVKGIINELSGALGMGDVFNLAGPIEEQFNKVSETITNSSAKLFEVVDLEAQARGLDAAKRIQDAINSGSTRAKNIFSQLWAALSRTWEWVKEKIIGPLVNGISAAWNWVKEKIIDPLIGIVQKAWQWVLEKIIDPLINGVKAVWNFIKEKIIDPLINGISGIFTWIKEKVFDPFMNAISFIFTFIKEKVFEPFSNAISSIFMFIKDKVFEPFTNAITSIFTFIKTKIFEPFTNALDSLLTGIGDVFSSIINFFANIGTNILDGLKTALGGIGDLFSNLGTDIWNGLKAGLDGLENFFKDLFDKLNPANLFSKLFNTEKAWGQGTIEETLSKLGVKVDVPFISFAQGGMVPGKAPMSGDSEINDRILALLSPGEAIIPRSIMSNPMIAGIIESILEGKLDVPKFALGGRAKIKGTLGKVVGGDLGGAWEDISNMSTEQAKKEIQNFVDMTTSILDMLNPMKMWEQVKKVVFEDMIWKMFEANKFETGGIVGKDTIPSLLSPGEYVINKDAARPNMRLLNQINDTGIAPSQGNQIFNITINTKTDLSPDQIRREVVPAIEKHLKRKSQDGAFIVSSSGVRA